MCHAARGSIQEGRTVVTKRCMVIFRDEGSVGNTIFSSARLHAAPRTSWIVMWTIYVPMWLFFAISWCSAPFAIHWRNMAILLLSQIQGLIVASTVLSSEPRSLALLLKVGVFILCLSMKYVSTSGFLFPRFFIDLGLPSTYIFNGRMSTPKPSHRERRREILHRIWNQQVSYFINSTAAPMHLTNEHIVLTKATAETLTHPSIFSDSPQHLLKKKFSQIRDHFALHHTTQHYSTPHDTALHYTAQHCIVLHHGHPHHTIPHHTIPHHATSPHPTTPHHTIHYTTPHYTTTYYTTPYIHFFYHSLIHTTSLLLSNTSSSMVAGHMDLDCRSINIPVQLWDNWADGLFIECVNSTTSDDHPRKCVFVDTPIVLKLCGPSRLSSQRNLWHHPPARKLKCLITRAECSSSTDSNVTRIWSSKINHTIPAACVLSIFFDMQLLGVLRDALQRWTGLVVSSVPAIIWPALQYLW